MFIDGREKEAIGLNFVNAMIFLEGQALYNGNRTNEPAAAATPLVFHVVLIAVVARRNSRKACETGFRKTFSDHTATTETNNELQTWWRKPTFQ